MSGNGYWCQDRHDWIFDYDSFEEEMMDKYGDRPVGFCEMSVEALYRVFRDRILKEIKESQE